jgi:hypothetical protein
MLAMSAGFKSAMRFTASDSVLVDAAAFAKPRPLAIDAFEYSTPSTTYSGS